MTSQLKDIQSTIGNLMPTSVTGVEKHITFYTTETSPWAHRVKIALDEVGATYQTYIVDLRNRPEWFQSSVNPANKVPAITYGPHTSPDQPHPDAFKLGESAIIVEFIADLFPSSGLMPIDPIARAKIRRFVDFWTTKVLPQIAGFVFRGTPGSGDALVAVMGEVQNLLLDGSKTGPFLLGEDFTLAEVCCAPSVIRPYVLMENGVCFYEDEAKEVLKKLKGEGMERFHQWVEAVRIRPSVLESCPEDVIINGSKAALDNFKAKAAAEQGKA